MVGGCEECFLTWRIGLGGLHEPTKEIWESSWSHESIYAKSDEASSGYDSTVLEIS